MEEKTSRKRAYIWYVPQIICTVLMLAYSVCIYFLYDYSVGYILQSGLYSIILLTVSGLAVRRLFLINNNDYELAEKKLKAFWFVYCIGFALSIACTFLSNTAWPFMCIFVLLGLFGGPAAGIVSGSALLMLSVLLSGESCLVAIVYFIAGALSIIVFIGAEKDFKVIKPLLISLIGLMTFLSMGILISYDFKASYEVFLMPLTNVAICAVAIYIGYNYYASHLALMGDEDIYLLLNDTSYPILDDARENDGKNYKYAVHTAHFCELIAEKLGMNKDVLKCAGYYYRFCPMDASKREAFYVENEFPAQVCDILDEYSDFIAKKTDGKIYSRECAVLLCSQMVVVATFGVATEKAEAEKLVDAAFLQYEKADTFKFSSVRYSDIEAMKQLFKEDKLYYDFLH